MKLLIITQKVDKNDPILGFFHRWIEEFAKNYEKITVVCLGQGEFNLPQNVKVLSLGKERGLSRFKYIWNFYKYLWQERKNYDKVFVHMNQEYVLLGGWWWHLSRKQIFFWRNHPNGNWLTILAVIFAHNVFCTSPFSFTARFDKTKIMPAGVDTSFFRRRREIVKKERSILYLGRISRIKKIEVFIKALAILKQKAVNFSATIVGDPSLGAENYFGELKKLVIGQGLELFISFSPSVLHKKTLDFYNQNEVFVNLTPSGSLDKTILEAMACGSIILLSNRSFEGKIASDLIFTEFDEKDLADKLEKIFNLSNTQKEELGLSLRKFVVENQSLNLLLEKFIEYF